MIDPVALAAAFTVPPTNQCRLYQYAGRPELIFAAPE
jgi:hypothetical protein